MFRLLQRFYEVDAGRILADGQSLADLPLFLTGLVFAFLSAWVCVRWLIRYVSSHNFMPFAWYRIAFGVLILVTSHMGWITWAE